MAIPKKGTRIITVEQERYRWLIRRKATYTQSVYGTGRIHIAIEHAEPPGTALFIYTDREHSKDCNTKPVMPVTPTDISNWVKQALQLNWKPELKGSPLSVLIENGKMKKCN